MMIINYIKILDAFNLLKSDLTQDYFKNAVLWCIHMTDSPYIFVNNIFCILDVYMYANILCFYISIQYFFSFFIK